MNKTDMPASRIVTNQKVHAVKVQRSKDLRREMTEEERVLWGHLRERRLNNLRFRRQQIIDGFIVDFFCHEAGLVVEVHGLAHDQQREYDAERDQILSARGLLVIRFRNDEVKEDLAGVLARIGEAVREQKDGDHGTV